MESRACKPGACFGCASYNFTEPWYSSKSRIRCRIHNHQLCCHHSFPPRWEHHLANQLIQIHLVDGPFLSVPCPGIPIEWDMDIFCDTYPFQIHSPRAKEQPKYDLILSEFPKVRSKQCRGAGVTAAGLLPCFNCSALKVDIHIIEERACRPYERIRNHDTLNSEQLHERLTVVSAKLNALKLKVRFASFSFSPTSGNNRIRILT